METAPDWTVVGRLTARGWTVPLDVPASPTSLSYAPLLLVVLAAIVVVVVIIVLLRRRGK